MEDGHCEGPRFGEVEKVYLIWTRDSGGSAREGVRFREWNFWSGVESPSIKATDGARVPPFSVAMKTRMDMKVCSTKAYIGIKEYKLIVSQQ